MYISSPSISALDCRGENECPLRQARRQNACRHIGKTGEMVAITVTVIRHHNYGRPKLYGSGDEHRECMRGPFFLLLFPMWMQHKLGGVGLLIFLGVEAGMKKY
ncbi:hypothetical protein CDAR_18311 [Caerostris darwini]|uniref:Uncharacterized protein n=1 Tax=Caerostris darwini TaxID=1538125 RepID=A0AAV4V9J6_9ARAC|nr:hypothetical protein CDAR_18311 [Caerostris darwini]